MMTYNKEPKAKGNSTGLRVVAESLDKFLDFLAHSFVLFYALISIDTVITTLFKAFQRIKRELLMIICCRVACLFVYGRQKRLCQMSGSLMHFPCVSAVSLRFDRVKLLRNGKLYSVCF